MLATIQPEEKHLNQYQHKSETDIEDPLLTLNGNHIERHLLGDIDSITDVQVLQLWDDAICRAVAIIEVVFAYELVEPIIRVLAAALVSDLHQPGPDLLRRGVDGDGLGVTHLHGRHQVISG